MRRTQDPNERVAIAVTGAACCTTAGERSAFASARPPDPVGMLEFLPVLTLKSVTTTKSLAVILIGFALVAGTDVSNAARVNVFQYDSEQTNETDDPQFGLVKTDSSEADRHNGAWSAGPNETRPLLAWEQDVSAPDRADNLQAQTPVNLLPMENGTDHFGAMTGDTLQNPVRVLPYPTLDFSDFPDKLVAERSLRLPMALGLFDTP